MFAREAAEKCLNEGEGMTDVLKGLAWAILDHNDAIREQQAITGQIAGLSADMMREARDRMREEGEGAD